MNEESMNLSKEGSALKDELSYSSQEEDSFDSKDRNSPQSIRKLH
jgi:hypothetical protein